MEPNFLYVGTYTENTQSAGIYCFEAVNGRLAPRGTYSGCVNPSYLVACGSMLYAAGEMDSGARITAFTVQPNGVLRLENELQVPGHGLCHLSVHPQKRLLFASNFGSGCFVVCSLLPNGLLGGVVAHIAQTGHGPLAGTQDGPHLHCATPSPCGSYLATCNLGNDAVTLYHLLEDGTPEQRQVLQQPPGSGPRHFAFHPSGRFAYVVNELGNTLAAFGWADGRLQPLEAYPLLPKGYSGECYAAGLGFSPDGRFLLSSTRGPDAIAVFGVNAETGGLVQTGAFASGGRWPRHFSFSPDGTMLSVANQKQNAIAILPFTAQTGSHGGPAQSLPVPSPTCAVWVKP